MDDQQLIAIFEQQERRPEELSELMIVCSCQQKVRLTAEDRWALCPGCGQRLVVISGRAQRADAFRRHGQRQESWVIDGKKYQFGLRETSGISAGSLVTIVYQATLNGQRQQPLGIADHSRQLWFAARRHATHQPALLLVRIIAGLAALAVSAYFVLSAPLWLLLLPLALGLLAWFLPDQQDIRDYLR